MRQKIFNLRTLWTRPGLSSFWLPTSLLAAIWILSAAFPELFKGSTLSPFLSLLSLFILAIFCSPLAVFFWMFPFLAVTHFLIAPYSEFAWVRLFTLALGGLITVYAAHIRTRTEDLLSAYSRILEQLPYPILSSDATSKILFFNEAASSALGIQSQELSGFSWFNLLHDKGEKSRDIERYVRLSLSSDPAAVESFDLIGLNGKAWEARLTKDILSSKTRLITTMLPKPATVRLGSTA